MPGFELVGQEELKSLTDIFEKSRGVMFAHGFDARRNNIFRVREFESALAQKFDAKHCQVVTSGTAAQFVTLKCMGIKPGDEVITQAFTFIATIEAIIECGATPVVIDVDKSLNMDPTALEKAITPKTKAIIPVHMLGNAAKMDEIKTIAAKHKLPVIEDACEALGSSYKGKPIGTIGDAGFFSLDFGKTITSGEGGFILTNDENLWTQMRSYTDHGHDLIPGIPRGLDTASKTGFNFRMSELQAAVGIAQLKKLDFILSKNRQHKKMLKTLLSDGLGDRIEFRQITDENGELADTLMFFLPQKEIADKVVQNLSQQAVGTKNVPDAMNWHFADRWQYIWKTHPLSMYKNIQDPWKKSRELLERCVSLPIMVTTSEADIEKQAAAVIKAVKEAV